MIIAQEARDVVRFGDTVSTEYGIEDVSFVIDLLSTKLYSDPIGAVVREYLTNAYDGHLALAEQNPDAPQHPPVIKLPTRLDPTLVITDYGIGMSYETCMKVYRVIAASLKRETNDLIGGFGIGAKAGFAYGGAEGFTIESRWHGVKYIFAAYKDERNSARFDHLGTVSTDEPNGVTIKISVQEEDFHIFYDRVARYLRYMPLEFEVKGATQVKQEKPVYKMTGDLWGAATVESSRLRTVQAIVGNVPYPLDLPLLAKEYGDLISGLPNNLSVDFYIPVGAVEIPPSREQLLYTEGTKLYLKSAFETFWSDVAKTIETEVDAAESLWDAYCLVQKKFRPLGLVNGDQTILWKGEEVSQSYFTVDLKEVEGSTVHAYLAHRREKGVKKTSEGRELSFSTTTSQSLTVLICDGTEKRTTTRAKGYVKEQADPDYNGKHRLNRHLYVVTIPGMEYEEAAKLFKGYPTLKFDGEVGDYKPVKEAKPKSTVPFKYFPNVNSRYADLYSLDIEEEEETLEEGGWYFTLFNDAPEQFYSVDEVQEVIRGARTLGIINTTDRVIGVPRSRAKDVLDDPNWKDLHAQISAALPALLKKHGKDAQAYKGWNTSQRMYTYLTSADLSKLSRKSHFYKVAKRLQELAANKETLTAIVPLARIFKLPLPEVKDGQTQDQVLAGIFATYPMLKVYPSYYGANPATVEEVVEYVGQCRK